MASFTDFQYCEMVLIYGECQRNATHAAREYAVRFPAGPHPSAVTIANVVRRLRETGSTSSRPRSGRPVSAGMRVTAESILAYALAHPHSSTRDISMACGLTRGRVWQILHGQHAHPYRVTLQQALLPRDNERRFDWCNWALINVEGNSDFLSNIVWSDEALFQRTGLLNRHNAHYWAMENPSWGLSTRHQVRWSINVWCGIWKDRLLGPVFYEGTLNGQRYLQLLQDIIPDFVDDIPLSALRSLWFQHDGAPAHQTAGVRSFLKDCFGQQIIGYGGSVEWPPRSPDLTPLDFFLWGYIKDQVYATPHTSLLDLRRRITDACNSVTPSMLRNVHAELLSRIQMCIVSNGELFEHTRH